MNSMILACLQLFGEVYKVMLFLDMPFQYLAIHDDCLTYIKGLLGMEQYKEAFTSFPVSTWLDWMNMGTGIFQKLHLNCAVR